VNDSSQTRYRVEIHKILVTRFSLEEIKTLCFELGVEYENLPSGGKNSKARELVLYLERRGRLDDLRAAIMHQRPDVIWPTTSPVAASPASSGHPATRVGRPGPAPQKDLEDLIPTQPGFLFISYSRVDQTFATKLAGDLRSHDIPVWLDDLALRTGDNWPQIIAEALDKCQAMLVIISPDSMASHWVENELSLADRKGKSIFPLLYRPTPLPGWFDLRFGNLQWSDFSQGDYQANFGKLIPVIQETMNPPTT
jgi:hypothetical protein